MGSCPEESKRATSTSAPIQIKHLVSCVGHGRLVLITIMRTAYLMALSKIVDGVVQLEQLKILSSRRPTHYNLEERWTEMLSATAETYEEAKEKLLTLLKSTKGRDPRIRVRVVTDDIPCDYEEYGLG